MTATVLLGDECQVLRQGLRLLLETEPDFSVIGEAADGLAVLSLVEWLQPDVLVLELLMPGLSGLEITRQITLQRPSTRIVILSMYLTQAYVAEALAAGARGYVAKTSSADELIHAIREAMVGRQYLSGCLSERAIELQRQRPGETLDRYAALTRREREVLHLVGEDFTRAMIAKQLVISLRTVDVHQRNLVRKLGLSGQAALARYAVRHRVIPAPDGQG